MKTRSFEESMVEPQVPEVGTETLDAPGEAGGSTRNPLFGVDVASYQTGLDFERLAELGYRFVISKATEGPYRDGSTQDCPTVDRRR